VLRFFVVPLLLVGASLAVFAGLGALVGQAPPTPEDLLRQVAEGGKNARWQAAQELCNQVNRGEVDLRRDERLSRAVAAAFEKARSSGDDPRVLELLAVLLGRARPDVTGPVLRGALADGSPDVRVFAVTNLAEQMDPCDVDALLARLDDLDPAVRAVAAYSAANVMAGADGNGPDGGVRGKPEWRAALAKALRDAEVDVRWNAALGLARLGDPAGADLVWSMLHRDYVAANLKAGDAPGASGFLALRGTDTAAPEEREMWVLLNALSAAFRLRDRSMADGVRALAASDPSYAVRNNALRAAESLDRESRDRGAVAQRTWTAAR
jgi:hypothetical protein